MTGPTSAEGEELDVLLEAVLRARQRREVAARVYRAAVLAAVDAGASFADVAEVAGLSRQAVRELVGRARPPAAGEPGGS